MPRTVKNVLVTGPPGCGKTTLVERVAGSLGDVHPAGFVTREIRDSGERKGFMLAGFDGRTGVLAGTGISGRYRVGRYGVDVAAFEAFLSGIPETSAPLVIVDEIGRMECLSGLFRDWIISVLDSPVPCLATIALKDDRFTRTIKEREDVFLCHISRNTRGHAFAEVLARVRELVP